MLGLRTDQFEEYNVDSAFPMKPIDILIGVKHCQVQTTPLEVIMDKNSLFPYLTVLDTQVGKGYSLQGTTGGSTKDYSYPIKCKKETTD